MNKKGGNVINDLDILGDIGFEDENTIDDSIQDTAALPDGGISEPEEVIEEPIVDSPVDEPIKEELLPDDTDEKLKKEREELDKWLDDLLKSSADVDDKVDEVKDAVDASGDESLIKLVEELQTLIAEKNMEVEELKKQVEVSNNRYLSKFGEEEELSLYRGEVEKLQENPRLMALVKFYKTDNEKVKPKLVTILSDMLYDITGQDVSDLLDKQDKVGLSILNTPSSDTPLIEEMKKEPEKDLSYEDSVNNILGI